MRWCSSPKVDGISFTGSVGVGRQIAVSCVSRQAKVQLEMGGKNPQIILDDADLKQAVELSVQSAFYSTGQRCTASSRFIVTAGIHDKFVEAMAERMKSIKVGHALKAGTDIGPVVSQAQLEQDMKYIDIGQSEGARLVSGGGLVTCDTEGYFLAPTLFADSEAAMRISREEIFGPVANIVRVADYDAALAMANDTEFGLSAGIATTSLKYANHFKRHSQAGMVMVNLPTAGVDYHVPFGGRKGSSYGSREQGRYAQEFYTVVKTAYTDRTDPAGEGIALDIDRYVELAIAAAREPSRRARSAAVLVLADGATTLMACNSFPAGVRISTASCPSPSACCPIASTPSAASSLRGGAGRLGTPCPPWSRPFVPVPLRWRDRPCRRHDPARPGSGLPDPLWARAFIVPGPSSKRARSASSISRSRSGPGCVR